jgi:hypothetical protein
MVIMLVAVGATPVAAQAQGPGLDMTALLGGPPPPAPSIAPGNEDCPAGEIYDDGSAENGYSGNSGTVSSFVVVQQFNPGGGQKIYLGACLAFVSLGGSDLDFELVAFADAAGMPGAEIASMPVSITGIPGGLPAMWYGFDTTPMGLNPTQPIFVGARFNPMAFPSRFVAADESGGTPLATSFVDFNLGGGWQTTQSQFSLFRAMQIRATTAIVAVPTMPVILLFVAVFFALVAATRELRRRSHA